MERQKFSLLKLPLFLLLCLSIVGQVSAKRILVYHGMASYSHRVQTWPLVTALTKLGHEVSCISPVPSKGPNDCAVDIVPKKMKDTVDKFINAEFDVTNRLENSIQPMHTLLFDMALAVCESALSSPEIKDFLESNKNKKFDLFIIDNCFAECGVGLARHLGAKYIIFNTVVPLGYEYEAYGYLPQSSTIPELEANPSKTPMGFYDRVSNTLISLVWRFKHYRHVVDMDNLLMKYLKNPKLPAMEDLMRNVSLVFHTSDVFTDYTRTLPPLYVNVAGTHCRETDAKLPKEIDAFINSTKPGEKNDGFVYISLGSVVVPSKLPPKIRNVFFDTVKSFPNVKFLWRWNGEFPDPKDVPKNLLIKEWFPQIDLLSHPSIRGFVTQHGRPSTLEALNLGVPMIGFPVLGDQDLNANRMQEVGATIRLEITTVTFEELKDAVHRVVYDPRVKSRMKQLQSMFRDRPMPPVETAVWWIEYVLRNEDTSHLRAAGNEQYWFVRRQVDVWAFLLIAAFVTCAGSVYIIQKLLIVFYVKPSPKRKAKKS